MSTLQDARILVADDQEDVARTLTGSLKSAGVSLQFVHDGEHAVERLTAGGLDLVIMDMKMPPGEWGGLWALEELASRRVKVPVVVLSGEGRQRETIQAMRLGASDWVEKSAAGTELARRCEEILTSAWPIAVHQMVADGPAPLAYAFRDVEGAHDASRRLTAGLHAVEEVMRFGVLLGLSTGETSDDVLRGVPADAIARPSFGTWLNAFLKLQQSRASTCFRSYASAVSPDKRTATQLRGLVSVRNDLAHGGYQRPSGDNLQLERLLERVAHRLTTTWTDELFLTRDMQFDGERFICSVLRMHGLGIPRSCRLESAYPLTSGSLVIADRAGVRQSMAPWVIGTEFSTDEPRLLLFDGVRFPSKGKHDLAAPLVYRDPASRARGLVAPDVAPHSWRQIAGWFGPG